MKRGMKKGLAPLVVLSVLLAALQTAHAATWFEYSGIEPPFNPDGNVLPPLTAGYIRTETNSIEERFKYWIINPEVNYVTKPVNGKMATVFTVPPGGYLMLTIALDHVRLNATTKIHVEVCFLTPSPPIAFYFGALRPHYDRSGTDKYSLGIKGLIGPGFHIEFTQENVNYGINGLVISNCLVGEWYAADLSTSMVPSATVGVDCWNFTGLYFACPAYMDITICCPSIGYSSYNETVEVAIANFALWDEKPADELYEIQTSLGTITADVKTIKDVLSELKASLSALGANVTQLIIESENRTVVQMQTLLGPINATLADLGGKITAIDGNVATVLIPGLGEVKAAVVDARGSSEKAAQTVSAMNTLMYAVVALSLIAAALSAVAACASSICLLKRRKAERTEVKGKKAAEGGSADKR